MVYSCMIEDPTQSSRHLLGFEQLEKPVSKLDIELWNQFVVLPESADDCSTSEIMSYRQPDWRLDYGHNQENRAGWQDLHTNESWNYNSGIPHTQGQQLMPGDQYADMEAKFMTSPQFSTVSYGSMPSLTGTVSTGPTADTMESWVAPHSDSTDLSFAGPLATQAMTQAQDVLSEAAHSTPSLGNASRTHVSDAYDAASFRRQSNAEDAPHTSPETVITDEDMTLEGRSHELYKSATRQSDGCFHCPFENQPSCTHPPTKLKCNLDKYIDSHLRPWGCKVPGCEKLQFSSVACRLRHEREAHGAHGHGVRPYLCRFPECERAKEGRGFPRSWNCLDHMRRVHNFVPPDASKATEDDDSTQIPDVPQSPPRVVPKKRSTTETKQADKRRKTSVKDDKKSRVAPVKVQEPQIDLEEVINTQESFRQAHKRLHDLVHRSLRPSDDDMLTAIKMEAESLTMIADKLKQLSASRGYKPVTTEACPSVG